MIILKTNSQPNCRAGKYELLIYYTVKEYKVPVTD